jgi:Kef-type K+ transport system membrane component KefB
MKTLQIASAIVELGAGLALLSYPSLAVAFLVGAPLEGPAAFMAGRVCGAALLALAVACWLARGDTQSRAGNGLVAAMLLYDVAVAAILAYAAIENSLYGVALWPAVILHTVMGVWCVACLRHRSLKLSLLEFKS